MAIDDDLDPVALCDGIVAQIDAFDHQLTGLDVNAERAYHYVDGTRVPNGELSIVVYPINRAKQRRGQIKDVRVEAIVVLKTRMKPTDRDFGDMMVRYVIRLDKHFENRQICDAENLMDESELLYFLPTELHNSGHFASVIALTYRATVAAGDNTGQTNQD